MSAPKSAAEFLKFAPGRVQARASRSLYPSAALRLFLQIAGEAEQVLVEGKLSLRLEVIMLIFVEGQVG